MGRAGGLPLRVQRAAYGHVACAENQRMFTVDDVLCANVQLLTRRNGGCCSDVVDGFFIVNQCVGIDAQAVTIDAACSGVGDLVGVNLVGSPVDQAPVGQVI